MTFRDFVVDVFNVLQKFESIGWSLKIYTTPCFWKTNARLNRILTTAICCTDVQVSENKIPQKILFLRLITIIHMYVCRNKLKFKIAILVGLIPRLSLCRSRVSVCIRTPALPEWNFSTPMQIHWPPYATHSKNRISIIFNQIFI